MPPLRMTVGDAFMRPWVFTRPLPNCGQGGMNAAPAGARRERIYAPLVYPSPVCGKGGMNAAPTTNPPGRAA